MNPSLSVWFLPIKKITEQPCSNGDTVRHTVLWEVILNCSRTLRVPHGSRPHGHDRNLVLCANDPVCWQSRIGREVTVEVNDLPVYTFYSWPYEETSVLSGHWLVEWRDYCAITFLRFQIWDQFQRKIWKLKESHHHVTENTNVHVADSCNTMTR